MFRIAPLAGETTASLLGRLAHRYGLEARALWSCWQWGNAPPPRQGGGVPADAEVLLNRTGRAVLASLCGVEQEVLARALPSWGRRDSKLLEWHQTPAAVWRRAGAVAGPVAFGCRLCTARRTGMVVRAVRYVPRRERVCARHGRWLLDADADQPLEYLELRAVPEVALAQRRWAGVARRAVRAGADPWQVFVLAHAVVCRWWEQALCWERETIWPRRLDLVAGGSVGADAGRWRVVGRDAVVFPEVVAVADALLDPVMAELVWRGGGTEQLPSLLVGAEVCRRLGERVGRPWLGPLAASDYGGPLAGWMRAVIRRRSGGAGSGAVDPWGVSPGHQVATLAEQARMLGRENKTPGWRGMWRAAVPSEQQALITGTADKAAEHLAQVRRTPNGPTAQVAQQLVRTLRHSTDLIDNALQRTVLVALNAGVPPDEVAQWTGMSAEAVQDLRSGGRHDDH
ncbi:DNA-binding protein [Streptomyces sp. SAI-117]|uniref:DNA-binding protein n=1 Tax=Streptomyces sp. SAI-117 TaxID=2940546 RepID=UPI0024746402|nr:DNA-binding protein [Streptomyces sp. SAI-117]